MQIVSSEDNLQEMSKCCSWEKNKKINLLYAEFVPRVVKVNHAQILRVFTV